MSKKIYHDQCKLNQILDQVEALSDIVDELRTELNHLKKISFNVNHESVCFESIKKSNKINDASPNVLQKVKAYFENIRFSTRIDETYASTKNNQKEGQEPSKFSTTYGGLKYCKNKIIKNIRNARKTQQSIKSTNCKTKNKYMCVTSSQEQHEVCLLRKNEEQKYLKFNRRNEDTNKYIDISKKLDDSADILFADISAQTDIAICTRQENEDKKSHNCNCLENHMKQTFLKNKIKRYKKCSCGKQCPYVLYKLPCNKYKCSVPEKKIDEINRLTLECPSFGEKRNFPKFIKVDAVRNNESLISLLSMDLEVNICNDYRDFEDVDEFTKRRKARTYIVNRTNTRKDDLINFKAEDKSFNITSSWRNINEKEEQINEIVKKVLSQKGYFEENYQGYKKLEMGNAFGNHWPIKNNKQIQCVIPALMIPIFNRKISVKTSTSNFQQRHPIISNDSQDGI